MSCQVADVRCPLGSVRQMIKAGNTLVFDQEGSKIINKSSGSVIPVRESSSGFEVDLWVPANKRKTINQATVPVHNRYQALESNEEVPAEIKDELASMDFIRQDLLL